MIRLASIGLGYSLVTLGVIGIIVPVLNGTVFLVFGLLILSRHTRWAATWLDWLKARNARFGSLIERAEAWVDRVEAWIAKRFKRSLVG
ncbi:MAG: PGPGW domain-containing protein [Geminicoccaceae bacterium]